MFNKFRDNIFSHNLVKENDTIIIGLSGGYDSMGLALCFMELKKEFDFEIVIAHVNHMMRGDESDKDESFVKEFAGKNKLSYRSTSVDMAGYARENKLSEEDAGRKLRYEFFYDLAKGYDSPVIATGHNLSDQAETVLLNLIRGTSLRGLTGMDFKTGIRIKPILNIGREEIEDFVDSSGMGHRDDKTNLNSQYRRNSIRNELIPFIEEKYNPNFINTIFTMADLLSEDYRLIEDLIGHARDHVVVSSSKDEYILSKESFTGLSYPMQKHLIRSILEEIKGDLSGFERSHIEEFVRTGHRPTGRSTSINGIELVTEYDKIKVFAQVEKIELKEIKMGIKDSIFSFGNYQIEFKILSNRATIRPNKYRQYFDADNMEEVIIRPRKDGDRMSLLGFDGTKKVKDILIDNKVPKYKRAMLPVFLVEDDIIWLGRVRRSGLYTLDKATEKILQITIEEKNGNN